MPINPSLLFFSHFIYLHLHFCLLSFYRTYVSSLDALEAAEEAYSEFLRSIAMKEAPDPIGIAPVNNSGNNNTSTSQHNAPPQQQYGAQAQGPPETGAEVTYPAPASTGRTRFWNQPRTPASTRTSFSSPAPTHRMEQPSFS